METTGSKIHEVAQWLLPLFAVLLLIWAAGGIPRFIGNRNVPSADACIPNLKQIDGAIQQWALENKKSPSSLVDMWQAKDFLRGSVLPVCPQGGLYTWTVVSNPPICSLSNLGHSL